MENKNSVENSKVVQRCNKTLEKLHDKREQHKQKKSKEHNQDSWLLDIFWHFPELVVYGLRAVIILIIRIKIFILESL